MSALVHRLQNWIRFNNIFFLLPNYNCSSSGSVLWREAVCLHISLGRCEHSSSVRRTPRDSQIAFRAAAVNSPQSFFSLDRRLCVRAVDFFALCGAERRQWAENRLRAATCQFDALSAASSGQLQRISIELGSSCTMDSPMKSHLDAKNLIVTRFHSIWASFMLASRTVRLSAFFQELKMEHAPAVD